MQPRQSALLALALFAAATAAAQAPWMVRNDPANQPDVLRVAFDKVNSNTVWTAGLFAAQADADTNAVVRSGRRVAWQTNGASFADNTFWVVPVAITNPAGVTFTTVLGQAQPYWAPVGTTNWTLGAPITTGVVNIAFHQAPVPSPVAAVNPVLTNITVFSLERPDLLGRTNRIFGQLAEVDHPVAPNNPATKQYVDDAVAAVSFMRHGGLYLAGAPVNHSAEWGTVAGTNGLTWTFLGVEAARVAPPTALQFAAITSISVTGQVVHLRVSTNGVTHAPTPHWSPSISAPLWRPVPDITNTWPTAVGTNFVITFPRPHPDMAFLRVAFGGAAPAVTHLSALRVPPTTITNASQSTWGHGAGLMVWDTNFIYVSVGTNQWRRATLSAW